MAADSSPTQPARQLPIIIYLNKQNFMEISRFSFRLTRSDLQSPTHRLTLLATMRSSTADLNTIPNLKFEEKISFNARRKSTDGVQLSRQ